MSTVFIGGSRQVNRLPVEAKNRLNNVIESRHQVIVGDANGVDKAVQKHLYDATYESVTVFCSGDSPRNNMGHWTVCAVDASREPKGYRFYAAKDREMARQADFGLMIWDGKSPGTLLNVLRLVRAGKVAVVFRVPDRQTINFRTAADWDNFLSGCSNELRGDLRERARPHEWGIRQQSLLEMPEKAATTLATKGNFPADDQQLAGDLNRALAAADPAAVVNLLGSLAGARNEPSGKGHRVGTRKPVPRAEP